MCFFFQAEDGIRDYDVTGVQTCALPIFHSAHLVNAGAMAHDPPARMGICFDPRDGMILPVGDMADE